jgi:hypothetical protein
VCLTCNRTCPVDKSNPKFSRCWNIAARNGLSFFHFFPDAFSCEVSAFIIFPLFFSYNLYILNIKYRLNELFGSIYTYLIYSIVSMNFLVQYTYLIYSIDSMNFLVRINFAIFRHGSSGVYQFDLVLNDLFFFF